MADQTVYVVIIAAGILGWVLLFKVVHAAREGIRWRFKAILQGLAVYLLSAALLPAIGVSRTDAPTVALVPAVIAVATTKRRSRNIPASVKRRVVARDLKGERYDSKQHHLDHIWPYSRGGSHTADNLRLISKKENLKKGAKKPGLMDWL